MQSILHLTSLATAQNEKIKINMQPYRLQNNTAYSMSWQNQ